MFGSPARDERGIRLPGARRGVLGNETVVRRAIRRWGSLTVTAGPAAFALADAAILLRRVASAS